MKESHITVLTIRGKFEESLKFLYPEEELRSLFFYALEALCGMRKTDFFLQKERLLTDIELHHFTEMIARLEKEEPIQYILGTTEFYGHDFDLSPDVLIPRPETEELVDWIIKDYKNTRPIRLIDIGTGSACIPVSISLELKEAKVYAIDVSPKALEIAKENASKHKCDIDFILVDILQVDRNKLPKSLDVIVSNPPYVLYKEKALMKKNVLEYEPHLALFVADNDPLLFYKKIALLGTNLLKVNGHLYFEINEQYGEEIIKMLSSLAYTSIVLKKDLNGKSRMLKASWTGIK